MAEKEITLSTGNKVIVKEVKYKDIIENSTAGDNAKTAKQMLTLSTGLTEEEYSALSLKDGVAIMNVVNEINGLTDALNFQQKNTLK